jgi:parvulin-like peptidyl-prolyl isomerase
VIRTPPTDRTHRSAETPAPRRGRTARRVGVAALGALAAVALTACSAPHTGAAAMVGSHRITTAAVQQRVANFRDAAAALNQGSPQENGGLTRNTVRDMIMSDVVAHALRDHDLTVTSSEIGQARASDAKQLGGEKGLRQALLEQRGVAPDATDDFYRRMLGLQKLAQLTGQDPNTEQGSEALRKSLAESVRTLKVEINPRYGVWDPSRITFSDGTDDWLHATAAPAS